MLSIFKKKPVVFFTPLEQEKIVSSIQAAEKKTSGEVRVYVERHCKFVDPLDRAREIFYGLKMEATAQRNGVLLYIALKDRQMAIFADEGIYGKVGIEFWKNEVRLMLSHFNKENYALGISQVILDIGELLSTHFPYDDKGDKNELPDEIVFGK